MAPLPFLIPFLVTGTTTLIIAGLIARSYARSRNRTLGYLAICFALIGVQNLSLSVPVLLGVGPIGLSWWHIVAVEATLFVLIASSRIEAYTVMAGPVLKPLARSVTGALITVAVVVLGIFIFDFQLPTLTSSSLAWNTPLPARLILSATFLLYGLSWAWLFWRHAIKLPTLNERIRLSVLGLDGALLGISGGIGYYSIDPELIRFSSFINLAVAALTVIMLIVTRRRAAAP